MAACSRTAAPRGADRLAFLRFDDLTGEQSFAWVADAAPVMLARELGGATRLLAMSADTVRDAYLDRATKMVHGYFEMRSGKLHFEIAIEDAARHKMIQTLSADGDIVAALHGVAKRIDPAASSFATSNQEAIAAWAKRDYAEAVRLDPDFGPAWLAWSQQLATTGNATEALATASRALARENLHSASDRAQLQILTATVQHDAPARIAALRDLERLLPADPAVHRSLAEAEMQARNFPQAVAAYRAAATADPEDPSFSNMLVYAEGMSGNLEETRKASEEYGRMPGQSVNALDSLGEAMFMNGKFKEAEQAFLEARAKDPAFLGGDTLWKAAHARWLGGDLAGADGLAKQYFEQRAKERDLLVVWRRANWLYETGRKDQAVATLENPPAETAELARKQIAVWNDPQAVPRDLAELKRAYENAMPAEDGLVRTFYAAALLQAGQRDQARKLVVLWPLPTSQDALMALMYPQFLELRRALQ